MRLQPWQFIAIPLGIWAFFFFGLAIAKGDGNWGIWAAPAVAISAGIYVLSPQINWWWYQRNPPPLSMMGTKLLEEYFGYYQKLSVESKERFRQRVSLFVVGNEFIRPVRPDDADSEQFRNLVPEEFKIAIAAVAAQVSLGMQELLVSKFEHFIMYPHAFPTPQYNFLHNSEIYDEDGVVLLATDPLMLGFNSPQSFFSIGLYEMSRVFKMKYPSVSEPVLTENDWLTLKNISGLSREEVATFVGLFDLDDFGIIAHHFFTFPHKFKTDLPDLFQLLSNIFHQDPTNETNPVLPY